MCSSMTNQRLSRRLVGARLSKEIAGIGISTDADAGSIVAFANSRANLESMVAKDPEFDLDSKWHIGEWDLDLSGSESADPLAALRGQLAHMEPPALVTPSAAPRSAMTFACARNLNPQHRWLG